MRSAGPYVPRVFWHVAYSLHSLVTPRAELGMTECVISSEAEWNGTEGSIV
ncbi:MAG: hypothetical protein UY31_C0044G0003 [Candidatus Wolfebacteria bacterium GW2011_GWE1_48_7]|uniref:Uncharacterized protein n=1 Tax=Candidatus Wolfebacteria bacterium GW2011_GWA2_47_9b TaxID=1619005 RepID=A0A0G1WHG6_9BACT|nr:MAG: hypothetical protein UX49_C0005G0032 [Candidatus Wolfebacteria bacterium GW2011_GWC2_46_275]KKU53821.1 MAG: hypothetical protein UX76_C0009G0011 [Candidatus Wolfebacteria bacterium GW2011_GWC1_47_103]KKU59450.1 MAG: hypothetical protein UX83_C0005G0069 [Candidatus Wolfebacteria bacterium GW2011_GWE2_47_12]KKU65967.1 MAG: hypothetical protein UX90_C0001G0025 [Candidatus Wolfebacteria bacterium GW2011_GWD2_47_17]KKU72983.1 MAG: hypothetical protein UX96_C0011G0032 [Candidatus Wolfebacteri